MPHLTIRSLDWIENPSGLHSVKTIFGPMWVNDMNGFATYGYCFKEHYDEAMDVPAESVDVAKFALRTKYLEKLQPALELVNEMATEVHTGTERLITETGRLHAGEGDKGPEVCINNAVELPLGLSESDGVAQGDRASSLKAIRRILKIEPKAAEYTTVKKMIADHQFTQAELAD